MQNTIQQDHSELGFIYNENSRATSKGAITARAKSTSVPGMILTSSSIAFSRILGDAKLLREFDHGAGRNVVFSDGAVQLIEANIMRLQRVCLPETLPRNSAISIRKLASELCVHRTFDGFLELSDCGVWRHEYLASEIVNNKQLQVTQSAWKICFEKRQRG